MRLVLRKQRSPLRFFKLSPVNLLGSLVLVARAGTPLLKSRAMASSEEHSSNFRTRRQRVEWLLRSGRCVGTALWPRTHTFACNDAAADALEPLNELKCLAA
jgi:hypothetical protein